MTVLNRSHEEFRDHLSRVEQMAADDGCTWDLSDNDQAALRAVLADRQRLAAERNLYWELIYEVARVYPGETRHETARRYIREREAPASGESAKAAVAVDPHAGSTGKPSTRDTV